MKFSVLVQQSLRLDGGINLSRSNAGVPEHFLDRTQIGPTAEQVGRKRVPKQMRFYVLRDARAAGVFFDDVPQGNPRERAATVAQK